jgi:nucleoside 2-deoxyribosyltransferase
MGQDSLFAFVLMPFDQEFEDRYRLGIKETAKNLGILAERVDEQIYREGILERIYRQIDVADIIIADMTGKNPNVFYEVGYAHAKGKLVILLTSEAADIPFDLKHRRHIVYGQSITILRERLGEELQWAKTEVENARSSRIKVHARTTGGELTKTPYAVTGQVVFTIDLNNESQRPSPEIEALYFYAKQRWVINEDGKECAWTTSDLPAFDRRSFLSLPVRRLAPGAWAQLKFSATARLANFFLGEEIKDSYKVAGKSVLRIVTSDGNFDHEVFVDAMIEEFPF